ncbi:MAG: phosphoglucosamine mutase [Gammaproteobacteria bacterium]|nr:phosphoglucosamine mutase [Gammaproteobacteria bacterium]
MPIVLPPDLMVSVSGFRGRVGDPLTPELVTALAAAYGAFLRTEGGERSVMLGRDSRTSGPMLAAAAAAGLASVGCDVVDVGIVPTPTLMMAVRDGGAAGGIAVTASHNRAEWNALKFATAEGVFLDAPGMARFRELLAEEIPRASWDRVGEVTRDEGAAERHLQAVLDLLFVEVAALRARRFSVALDCVHGAGGAVMPELLERLGCRVHGIGLKMDGRFPRDPEPTAENLGALGELVRDSGADLGMAVDPDVDRLSLVDETGAPVGEDFTLALAAATVTRRRPGLVVTNLSTSQVVEDAAAAAGAKTLRAPVGEINVVRRMLAEGAVVGGEGNGGVVVPALHHTRDALVGSALVLQHLLDEKLSLAAAVAAYPAYRIVKHKVAFPRDTLEAAYARLQQRWPGADRDRTDGLRLTWPDRREWLHVRPSGTEPVVRLIAEARAGQRARALVEDARGELSRLARSHRDARAVASP